MKKLHIAHTVVTALLAILVGLLSYYSSQQVLLLKAVSQSVITLQQLERLERQMEIMRLLEGPCGAPIERPPLERPEMPKPEMELQEPPAPDARVLVRR